MRTAVAARFLGAIVFLGLALALPNGAVAQTVGRTPGTFAVSQTGAATYTIPLFAPPGPRGMQPHMALVYNSQSGNGYLGVGWNLSGLSSIYRCNLTDAQDGAPAAVTLSTGDGYCLDGQRLRLTSGTYGEAGSTYQTEIANFENVTAYGSAGNGPAYFIVQMPNGRTYEYGNDSDGANSQVPASGQSTVLTWMLDKVSDPAGNTMSIAYCPIGTTGGSNCPSTALEGTTVPSTISWTPTSHGAISYAYTMTFNYGTNAAPPVGYTAGTPIENPYLLGSITIDYSGAQVKEYVLGYQQSATSGRDILTEVQECSSSASTCLYPTTIAYQAGSAGVSTSATTAISNPLSGTWGTFVAHYDVNGDGYADLVYEIGTNWYVSFGSANGYGTPVSTGISGELSANVLIGDLLGTGKAGILADNGGTWYYYTWNGSSFAGSSTGLAYDSNGLEYALADVNGDGLPDLVEVVGPNSNETLTTRLNTSSGGTASFSSTVASTSLNGLAIGLITPDTQQGNLKYFDFNGDGRQDLAFQSSQCAGYYMGTCMGTVYEVQEAISQPDGTFTFLLINGAQNAYINTMFANLNDDACTDVIQGQVQTAYISACNGSSDTSVQATYPIIAVMDWNGDGRSDLIESDGSSLYVQLSTGTGFAAATSITVPDASNCTYVAFDADADGLDDLGCMSTQSGAAGFTYYLHNGAGQPADLVTSIADGYGNSVSPTYVPITQNNYNEYTDATYPDQNYIGPLYVVNQATFSDPSNPPNGTYQQSFWYYGAWTNLQGRGFDGFDALRTYDSRNALYDTRYFGRAFPYTGIESQDLLSNGTHNLSQRITTYAVNELSSDSGQQRYFPYPSSSVQYAWEVGGPKDGALITSRSTGYKFDSYGNATSITTTVTDSDSGSPYYEDTWTTSTTNTPDVDTSTWCLNLLSERQVSYSSSVDGPATTRTKSFTPDTGACDYTQIVTEPSSAAYKVTETLGYDLFGNVDSDTVTGVNMSARTTTVNWGTTGQLPEAITDPTNATTTLGYDWRFGLPSGRTDPNQLPTSWQYDAFGRKDEEIRSDGTSTIWLYNTCQNAGGCYVEPNLLAVSKYVNAVGGALISAGTTDFDALERPLISNKIFLSGYYRHEVRYDSLGRVVKVAAPCMWSSVTTPCPYWTTNTYDVLNRLTESQRPISSGDSSPQSTTYQYEGRTKIITDANGHARTLITDVNGRLRQSQDAGGYSVTIGYDAAGSKTSVVDSNGTALWSGTYQYGVAPYLVSSTDADLGAWSYTHDALGELIGWTDAKGQQFSAAYDALSRMTDRYEPDQYTHWTWGTSASAHEIGKLHSVCTGTGSDPTACSSSAYAESETYDSLGRLYQRAIAIPGDTTYTYTWQYDSKTGLLSTLTYPVSAGGYQLELQYGYLYGNLQSITDVPDQVTYWTANAMDPMGQVTQETLGNGIVVNHAYDAVTGWPASITAGPGGGTALQNYSYLFDEVGNVTERQDNNLGLTENFYYDSLNRLLNSTLNGTQNLVMSYQGNGNIASYEEEGPPNGTYDYTTQQSGCTYYANSQPHAVHSITWGSTLDTYCYDADGNNITATQVGYGTLGVATWMSFNQPAELSSTPSGQASEFSYDQNHQRWLRTDLQSGSPVKWTEYIGGLMEKQHDTSGNVTFVYHVPAGSTQIVKDIVNGTATDYYITTDNLGSAAKVTDKNGNLVVGENFDAWGWPRGDNWAGQPSSSESTTAAAVTHRQFEFQEEFWWLDSQDFNGRIYVDGSFMSPDPTIPDATNPQSYNRYSYALNDPLTYTDPTGFAPDPVGETDQLTKYHCVTKGEATECPPLIVITGCGLSCQLETELAQVLAESARTWTESAQTAGTLAPQQAAPLLPPSGGGSGSQQETNSQQQSDPKQPQKQTACSNLDSFSCDVCVNNYLNNTYGTFGGFVASTFNAQQTIPGISGNSALDTLTMDGELAALKQGVPWALRTVGDAVAMGSKTPVGFWGGGLTETTGILASDTLLVIGAATTPFASIALHNARSNCGG